MTKTVFILLIFMMVYTFGNTQNIKDHSQQNVDYVINKGGPVKGEFELILEKRLEIDPPNANNTEILLFDNFWRDLDGSVYIFDYKHFKIHKFNNQGMHVTTFLNKGEGQAEVLSYPKLQFSDSFLWVFSDKKILKFKKSGEIVKEYKLKNFYYSLKILDEDKFVAFDLFINSFNSLDNKKDIKSLSIYDLNTEKRLKKLFSSHDTGRFYIKKGNSRMAVIPETGIVPDIVYDLNLKNQRIYVAENYKYEIRAMNFNSDIEMIFSRPTSNPILSKIDKREIAESMTTIPNFLKLIQNSLPKNLCAIKEISLLSNGYIGVFHIIGYKRLQLDIFDAQGKYLMLLKFPVDFKAYRFKIYNDILGILFEKKDETVVYREYYIKPLKDLKF